MQHRSPEPSELREQLDAILEVDPGPERSAALGRCVAGVRPEDIAEILGHYGLEERVEIFGALPPEAVPEVLDETDDASTRAILAGISGADLSRIIEQMPPDEATDLVAELPEERQEGVLAGLDPETAVEVRRLLQHHPESAGGIMTSDFIAVEADRTAGEVLEHVQRIIDTEVVSYVYVVDARGALQGVFSIRDLLRAKPIERVSGFMSTELIVAHVDDDQEKVATLARKYNLSSIPVVDAQGRLVGVATIDDIIDIIAEEADEDIYRMAGTADSHPAQQHVLRRAFIRIPWLLLPVVSGFVIAWFHTGDDHGEISTALTDQLAFAAFLPLVMGIAGSVGTQSAIMMVRGMATGDIDLGRGGRVFAQEFGIGIIIAFAIGGLVFLCLTLVIEMDWIAANSLLPAAVGAGLFGTIVLSGVSGTVVPIGFTWMGRDPALSAGPFITSLNDVLAAATYFGLGQVILFAG